MHGRLRLVPVVASAWTTAYLTTVAPGIAPIIAAVLWTLSAVSVIVAGRRRRERLRYLAAAVAALSLAAGAAVASHVALAQPARSEVAALVFDGTSTIEVQATVVGKVERWSDGSLAFDAIATLIRVGTVVRDVRAELAVQVDPTAVTGVSGPGGLDVGARITAQGSPVPADPGDRAVFEVRATRGVIVEAPAEGILALGSDLRRGLVRSTAGLPGQGAGLVPGLSVGDTSAVDPALDDAMKRSSLSHLTAVSGANCALVVGLAFLAAAALGAGRRVRVAAGLAALSGFVVLVTPEPSVVRAGTMAAIAMIGVLLGRVGAGTAVLGLSITLLLIVDPWLAGSLGFALSAAATASLLLFARPLATGLAKGMPRALAFALSVPLAAQLACGPLLVLIEPTVPVYGVLANLLAAPAAPLATVVGLAACLALPLPWLQSGLTAIAWLPASWIAATAHTVTTLPGDLVPWLEGWAGAGLLTVVGVALGTLIAVPRARGGPRRVARTLSGSLMAVVVGIAVGSTATTSVAGPLTLPRDWSILACDVGQGDAVLLRSADSVALVDTGPDPAALTACLGRVGIAHIDLLVLTHFDIDHVGGVDAIRGSVGTVLHGPATAPADRRTLERLAQEGAQLVAASSGMTGALGDATWRIVWPRDESAAFPSGNDASVVIDIRGGGVPSTLLLGDLSASPQAALGASGALADGYAVVKVAHHGSADQDPALYQHLGARVALVTVGADNDYGHPRREILDLVSTLGARVARTDTDGLIALTLRNGAVELWREHAPAGDVLIGR